MFNLFKNNKYSKWYLAIIKNAKSRVKLDIYYETHHIIPRSLGGSDSIENLVVLTAREHFICHLLLPQMLDGEDKYKMRYAIHLMMNMSSKGQERYIPSAIIYEQVRKQHSANVSAQFKGKPKNDEFKQMMSVLLKGRVFSEETIARMSEGQKKSFLERGFGNRKGIPMSDETKTKLSKSLKGKQSWLGLSHSEETKEKMRKPKPKEICPHCQKLVAKGNQFHFNRCKMKPEL